MSPSAKRPNRAGAMPKPAAKKGATKGSGGNRKRSLEGKKNTPKAEERPYHKAYGKTQRAVTARKAQFARKNTPTAEYVLGRNPVLECLTAHIPANALYVMVDASNDERLTEAVRLAADRGLPIMEIPRADLERMVDNSMHQGIALQVPPFQYCQPEDLISDVPYKIPPLIVALDNISDPRNLGAVIRSAAAFAVAGVLIPARRSAGVTAVAWRTSAGTAAHVPVAKAVNMTRALDYFAKQGFHIVGLDIVNAISVDDFEANSPTVVVVGSEGKGISRLVREKCDTILSIPMAEHAESLNASVAASIVLAEFRRQHRIQSK